MVSATLFAVLVFIWAVGDVAHGQAECIKKQLSNDIGAVYDNHYDSLKSTAIVRIKQALQEVWKDEGVIKKASNGQMTIDKNKFSQYGDKMKGKKVGAAVTACKNSPDASEMYKEAARGVQCIFGELKKKC